MYEYISQAYPTSQLQALYKLMSQQSPSTARCFAIGTHVWQSVATHFLALSFCWFWWQGVGTCFHYVRKGGESGPHTYTMQVTTINWKLRNVYMQLYFAVHAECVHSTIIVEYTCILGFNSIHTDEPPKLITMFMRPCQHYWTAWIEATCLHFSLVPRSEKGKEAWWIWTQSSGAFTLLYDKV